MKKPECFGSYLSQGQHGETCIYRCEAGKRCRLDRAIGESIVWNNELGTALENLGEEIGLEEELILEEKIGNHLEKIKRTTKPRWSR